MPPPSSRRKKIAARNHALTREFFNQEAGGGRGSGSSGSRTICPCCGDETHNGVTEGIEAGEMGEMGAGK